MKNISRGEFLRFMTLAAVGAGAAACASRREDDPSDKIRWTPIGGSGWMDTSQYPDQTSHIRQANLVGGGCPCSIELATMEGRELEENELALLTVSKYYIGVAAAVNLAREDIESTRISGLWHQGNGYIDEADLRPNFRKDGSGRRLSGCTLYVEKVVNQLRGGNQRFGLRFGKENLLVETVRDSSGKTMTNRERLVVWPSQNGGLHIYRQSLGLEF